MEQHGGVVGNALHLVQLRSGSLQHAGQGPKPGQQRVGDGVGIPPGDAVKQQQLQYVDIGKTVQPFREETLLQPLPVAVMDRHIFYLRDEMSLLF